MEPKMKAGLLFSLFAIALSCKGNPVNVDERASCPPLPPLENGTITFYESEGWADVCRVIFTCDPGFTLSSGTGNLYCFFGEWFGDIPTCTETIECPPLDPPTNGILKPAGPHPVNHLHSIMEVVCDEGYFVDGNDDSALLCREGGQWSAGVPKCTQKQCDERATITGTAASATSCGDIKTMHPDQSEGVFLVDVLRDGQPKEVYCDLSTDGGNWLVFQKRFNGEQNFNRGWNKYVNGFGDVHSEFWLGLETLHILTETSAYELRVDLEDWNGNTAYAVYSDFSVGAGTDYTLTVGGHNGTAGDSLNYHNRMRFSTRDNDQDEHSENCAVKRQGGFWYNSCSSANVNGAYGSDLTGAAAANEWERWAGQQVPLKATKMMLRKKN